MCSRRAAAPLLLLLLLASSSARAFCPTNGTRCGVGGSGKTHQDLTEEAMEALSEEFFGISPPTQTMRQASEEVWQANAAVDDDQTNGFLHFDGESFTAGKQRLVTLFSGVLTALRAEDARAARSQLGQALHSLQDFYSHSTWVESGRSGALPSLWRANESLPAVASPDTTTCKDCVPVVLADGSIVFDCGDNVVTPLLTTGYYGGENEVPRVPTKCRHGGPFDKGPGPLGGINKDSFLQSLSPHHTLHATAADSALDATEQFLRDLAAQLTPRQLRLLFGVGPDLVMAVDSSKGLEGSLLAQFAREVARLAESRRGTVDEPVRAVVVPFRAASSSGEGACVAPSLTAATQALERAGQGVDFFLLTHSRPGDAGLVSALVALAQRREARIHVLQFGACGGEDVHRRLATETGGQFFALQSADLLPALGFVDATVRANAVQLLSVADSRGGASFPVAIDSSLSRVTFSLSGGTSGRLVRPDGSPVLGTEPGVRVTPLSTGLLVTMSRPAPGLWTVTPTVRGAFSLRVSGESPEGLERFEFVALFGRPGHQGQVPRVGLPLLSGTLARAQVSPGLPSPRFELRSRSGALLLPRLPLALEPGGSPLEFFGPVLAPPSEGFVVHAVGTTSRGEPYQRSRGQWPGTSPAR